LTVPGHVINGFFSVIRGHLNNVNIKTKTAVFLTTRHFIPNFDYKINKTHVKDDLTTTPSFTYCIENKTRRIMK